MILIYYSVWCEYDIGSEGYIFSSEDKAKAWAKKATTDQGLDFNDLDQAALIGVTELEMDP